MMKRSLLISAFGIFHLSLPAQPASRPNVLFIAVDDLRPQLGCYGDAAVLSPHIDRLAARGVVFERAYVQQAVCGPSRASVLSGLRPDATGVITNAARLRERHPRLTLLPGLFSAHGYHTLALGKVHHWDEDGEGSWSEPVWRPFGMGPSTREYLRPENLALVRQLEQATQGKTKKPPGLDSIKGPAFESLDLINDVYPDGLTADAAVQALKRLKTSNQPFFLAVGFIKPHLPFACPRQFWDRYDPAKLKPASNDRPPDGMPEIAFFDSEEMRQYHGIPKPGAPFPEDLARTLLHGYLACVSYMDAQVGRLLDALDELALSGSTIIVLWGDHGWHLGEQGIWGKSTNFESATRAPLIVAAPGVAQAGGKARGLVEFVDIYPTLAELCGLPLPSHLQGASLVPLLRDPARPGKTAAFSQFTRPGHVTGYSIRTDRWRYTEWLQAGGKRIAEELYDHQTDAGETRNAALDPRHASIVEHHRRELHAHRLETAPGKPAGRE